MCDANRKAILDKIRKLLEHTEDNGATKAEAIQFALKAQQLIAEYDVQEYELCDSATAEPIEEAASGIDTPRTWRNQLAYVVSTNFRCKNYFSRYYKNDSSRNRTTKVCFYGYRYDAKAAALVFDRLYAIGDKLAREYVKAEKEAAKPAKLRNTAELYNTFTWGFVKGVQSVLEKQSQALMIVCPKEVEDSYEQFSEGFARPPRNKVYILDNAEAQESGFQAGKDAVYSGRIGAEDPSYLLNAG